jgi:protein-S-isoprenylcysteine O-methyltransferase Ste14
VRTKAAAIGTALFVLVGPGLELGLGPWLITGGWERGDGLPSALPIHILGGLLLAAGLAVIAHALLRFVVEGVGTPSPALPPERLVVGGAYRYVRNPMYVATAAALVGQALLLSQPILLVAAAAFTVALGTFVRLREEPRLARRFGAEYDAYRRAVPGWRPRLRPWDPGNA